MRVTLDFGIRTFDSRVVGLGGCPCTVGATGSVATENLVYFLESRGLRTGIDLDALVGVGQWISHALGRRNASRVGCALATVVLVAVTTAVVRGPVRKSCRCSQTPFFRFFVFVLFMARGGWVLRRVLWFCAHGF